MTKTPIIPLVVGHASLNVKASPEQVARLMKRFIRTEGVHLAGCTEGQTKGAAKVKALRAALGDGYGVQRRGEYLHIFDREVLALERLEYHRLTRQWGGASVWRDTFVSAAWFRHLATGLSLRDERAHLPAGMQSGRGYRDDTALARRQAKTHRRAMSRWGDRLDKRLPKTRVIAGADFNTDFFLDVWRDRAEDQLGLDLCWSQTLPPKGEGTHHKRLIDGVATNMEVLSTYVSDLTEPRVFDHEQTVTAVNMARLVA